MADGRMLKRKISIDWRLAELAKDSSRLLFTWGIAHLDIEGRMTGDPMEFRAAVAPLLTHITKEVVLEFFEDAGKLGLIHRYEVGNQWIIQYPGFKKNQTLRPEREAKSQYPAPSMGHGSRIETAGSGVLPNNSGTTPGMVQENSSITPDKGSKSKLNERKGIIASPPNGNGDARPRFACSHFEISEMYFSELLEDYPGLTEQTLILEIKKARDWLDDNPSRHRRNSKGGLKSPKTFLRNWLDKVLVQPSSTQSYKKPTEPISRAAAMAAAPSPEKDCPFCKGSGKESVERDGKHLGSRPCRCLQKKKEISNGSEDSKR